MAVVLGVGHNEDAAPAAEAVDMHLAQESNYRFRIPDGFRGHGDEDMMPWQRIEYDDDDDVDGDECGIITRTRDFITYAEKVLQKEIKSDRSCY